MAMANEISEMINTLMAIRLFGLEISGCLNIVKSFQEKAATIRISKK
jgi:hypothetical protein